MGYLRELELSKETGSSVHNITICLVPSFFFFISKDRKGKNYISIYLE